MADSLAAGTYTVTITDINGCIKVDTIVVSGIASPTADYSNTPEVGFVDIEVLFNDSSLANGDTIVSWFWDFGDGVTSILENPTHTYDTTGTFLVYLVVTNSEGCVDTISDSIIVVSEIFVPNFFTPNGDDMYDNFVIPYLPQLYPNSKLYVYNRWGIKVYQSDNYQNDWDGEKHSAGT